MTTTDVSPELVNAVVDALRTGRPVPTTADIVRLDEAGNTHWIDFATRDLDAMLAHIAEYRAAGHVVPDWVDQALRDDWGDA